MAKAARFYGTGRRKKSIARVYLTNGKGNITLTLTGHVSINAQSVMPMEFYSIDPDSVTSYKVTQTLAHVASDYTSSVIDAGDAFEATLTADDDYTIENVVVTHGGEDVTETAYASATGVVSIASVAGDIMIVATAVAD